MKKIVLFALLPVIGLTSCVTKLAISSGDESLSALSQVTDNEEPCVTPFGGDNGKNLFFAVRQDGKYYNIYKKENPFAAALVQKTSGNNLNYSPSYSSVIDKIVFRCQNDGSATSDIFMMTGTKGKALTQVTETPDAFENHPSISADGKFVVYDRQTYYQGNVDNAIIEKSEIWIKNLVSGENSLLGNGYQPRISPDNKKIAFTRYSSDAKSCSIWIMDINGDNQAQLTDAKKGYAFYPSWSPDGTKIIFQSTKKDKKDYDIYIINVDGENLVQLTKNKSSDVTPYWTTDNFIYFSSDRGNKKGNSQIWRFKLEK